VAAAAPESEDLSRAAQELLICHLIPERPFYVATQGVSVEGDTWIDDCNQPFEGAIVSARAKWNFFGDWVVEAENTGGCTNGWNCLAASFADCRNGTWKTWGSGVVTTF